MTTQGFHCSGSALDRTRAPRLRRLLSVDRMRKAHMSRKEIAAAVDISLAALCSDIQLINEFGVDAIRARLEEAEAPSRPQAPTTQRHCVYLVPRNGTVRRCGKTCKGQLCDEHKSSTAPLPGTGRWPGGKAQSKTGRF
ncbi:hypothetical protein D1227_06320 [Henriciella mobilis]|nr:hypothetical protein D1231_09280 [Henriciella mobilis]RIJ21184.1 hypothetical protein D1227_12820 [Henriciella mobilis]RIJ23115.1 hypothetical protein D1227_06320 [Henriciella mobilis]